MVRLPDRPLKAAAALVVLGLIGCGTSTHSASSRRTVPAVPEPATAPARVATPAGRVVPVGPGPEGVVVDPGTGLVAVGLRDPAAIAVLDTDGRELRRLTLPAPPRHLSAGPAPGLVLVPAETADRLLVVDVRDGRIVNSVDVGRNPHDAVSVGARVFVGDEAADTVHVVDGGRVGLVLPGPVQPGGLAAASGVVVVVGVRGRRIAAYDAESLAPLGTLATGVGPTHVVTDGRRFYVADTQGDALLVDQVTRAGPTQVGRVGAVGAPYGLAVDAARHRLWVTLTARNRLVLYDIASGVPRAVRSWPTVRQPNSVAVNPTTGRVYVTGTSEGTLQMIDAEA